MLRVESLAPLAAALGGGLLLLASRGRAPGSLLPRLASLGDVAWCGTAILVKTGILYAAVGARNEPGVVWLDLTATALLLLLLLLLPQRYRPWASLLVAGLVSLWIWGDIIHFRFFEDVASAAALLAAGNGLDLLESIVALLRWRDLLLVIDLVPAFFLALELAGRAADGPPGRFASESLVAMALLAGLLVPGAAHLGRLLQEPTTSRERKVFHNVTTVQRYGLLGFHLYDARRHLARRFRPLALADSDLAGVRGWFLDRAGERAATSPWFGAAEGSNLIIVAAESMQAYVVDLILEGQEITPNINRRLASALVFGSTIDQTGIGRTSDAELLVLTSLLPSPDVAAAFAYAGNDFHGLPEILEERGYATLSAAPFRASFWNRHVTHPVYGFSRSLFRSDFAPGTRVGWGLNDRDFLAQALERIDGLERPFFAFLMPLGLHHPYREFPDDLRKLDPGLSDGSKLGNYLEAMHLFDSAFEEFFGGLEARGLADDTVVVLLGDHDAGMRREQRIMRHFGLGDRRPIVWDLLFDRVPMILWVPAEQAPRGRAETDAGLADLPVTLLALLGVDPAGYAFMGRNLLGAPSSTLVVNPKNRWIDATHYYRSRGASLEQGECWLRAGRTPTDVEQCRAGFEAAELQRLISDRVLDYDLQSEITEFLQERVPTVRPDAPAAAPSGR